MDAIVLSFIGKTQSYLDECIYQIRLFTDKPIYYIYNDYNNELVNNIHKNYKNIHLINYELVKSNNFDKILNKKINRFHMINDKNRKELFIRSIERFYLLYNLCILKQIENVLFLELDNLIYNDPNVWFSELTEKKLYYMLDNKGRCGAGLFISRNNEYLNNLLDYFNFYILNDNEFLNEMSALYNFYIKSPNQVYILPTHWNIETYNNNYKNSIFDASSIGIYLFGIDLLHSNGILTKGKKNPFAHIDFTYYKYKWIKQDKLLLPFIEYIDNTTSKTILIKINNLHIHAKNLSEGLSLSKT